jgi:hypothetical protein
MGSVAGALAGGATMASEERKDAVSGVQRSNTCCVTGFKNCIELRFELLAIIIHEVDSLLFFTCCFSTFLDQCKFGNSMLNDVIRTVGCPTRGISMFVMIKKIMILEKNNKI